jgi:hypothetical protein
MRDEHVSIVASFLNRELASLTKRFNSRRAVSGTEVGKVSSFLDVLAVDSIFGGVGLAGHATPGGEVPDTAVNFLAEFPGQ